MARSNLAKNTIFLSVGSLLTNAIQFLVIPFFSRWLTTAEYGTFDLYVTYVSLMLPVINLASGEAVFRFSIDADKHEQKRIITDGLSIVLINTVIVSVILCALSIVLKKSILIPFLFLVIGQIFNSFAQSFLRGIKKLKIYSLGSALSAVFIAITVTLFVWKWNLGLNGIILGYAAGYICGDVVIFVIAKVWDFIDFSDVSLSGMKELIKYSYPLIPNNICWWVINASDRLIITSFLGNAYNGIYAIAHKIPNVCSSVFGMFNISWQEAASGEVNSNSRNLFYNSVYNSTISVLLSLCTGILSLNFVLFDYVFDIKYYNARLYVPILLLAIILSSVAQFYGGIMISFKMPKDNGSTTVVAAIINVIVHIALIKFIGLYAAAISTAISNGALCFIRKNRLRKEVRCRQNKEVYVYWLVFTYMFVIAYFKVDYSIRFINFLIACIFFFVVNKKFIMLLIKKLVGRMRKEIK